MKKTLALVLALALLLGCMSFAAAEGGTMNRDGLTFPELPNNTLKLTVASEVGTRLYCHVRRTLLATAVSCCRPKIDTCGAVFITREKLQPSLASRSSVGLLRLLSLIPLLMKSVGTFTAIYLKYVPMVTSSSVKCSASPLVLLSEPRLLQFLPDLGVPFSSVSIR